MQLLFNIFIVIVLIYVVLGKTDYGKETEWFINKGKQMIGCFLN
jgi:hypothetical protein